MIWLILTKRHSPLCHNTRRPLIGPHMAGGFSLVERGAGPRTRAPTALTSGDGAAAYTLGY